MKEYEFASRELALLASFGEHQNEVKQILLNEIKNKDLLIILESVNWNLYEYIQSLLNAYQESFKSGNCENIINAFLPKPKPKSKFFIHKCQI